MTSKKAYVYSLFFILIMIMVFGLGQKAHASYYLPDGFCRTFSTDLNLNSSNGDVSALRQILVSQGFLSENELSSTVYTKIVATAVTKFQEKYSTDILKPNGLSKGTGTVGKSTRSKLNSFYKCAPTPTTSTKAKPIVTISSGTVSAPVVVRRNESGEPLAAAFYFNFSITNNELDPLYISKNANLAVATQSNLDTAAIIFDGFSAVGDSSGDTDTSYYVPVNGTRSFQTVARLDNTNNAFGAIDAYVRIPRILYATSTQRISNTLTEVSAYTDKLNSTSIKLQSN